MPYNNQNSKVINNNCVKETLLPYKLIYSSPCDSCRKNRIKCDRDPKECAHCKRKGVKCTYLYTRKKRGPKGKLHHLMQQFESTLKSQDPEPTTTQFQLPAQDIRDTTRISSLLNPEPHYQQPTLYTQKTQFDNQQNYNFNYYHNSIVDSENNQVVTSTRYFEEERRSNSFFLPSSQDLINHSTLHKTGKSPHNSSDHVEHSNDNHFITPRKNSTINNYNNSLYSEFN